MTARYEPIMRWSVPRGVVPATLRGILRAARERHEGGAFWLGMRSTDSRVDTVVLLHGPGVSEQRGYWEVSALVYGIVGEWASAHGQALLAIVHSHEGSDATWLSPLDQRGGVHVPDMLAVVVPGFGRMRDPRSWGFHRFDCNDFVELAPRDRDRLLRWVEGDVAVIHASENGIKDG